MRGGYLLAESSPDDLVARYQADSLEDVFLKLSVIQNMGKRRRSSIATDVATSITVPPGVVNEAIVVDDEPGEISGEFGDNVSIASRRVSIAPDPDDNDNIPDIPPSEDSKMTLSDYLHFAKWTHMRTLVWKNALWMIRNISVMLFIIGLPVIQCVLFCFAIGHDPYDVPISVVTNEINLAVGERCENRLNCNSTTLSCSFLDYLEKRTLKITYYPTLEGAKDIVRAGKSWAAVEFKSNFSDSLRERINNAREITDADIEFSEVNVWQDQSNENVGTFLKRDLYFSFMDFLQDYLETCNINRKIGTIPVRFEDPVYGYRNPNFTDFAAPGVILTIIFFLAVALTSGAMLLERNEGILERSLVIGITSVEILFAHVVTQFIVMLIQTILVLIVTFAIFDITLEGSIVLVFVLTILTGLCGMCFGFVVSTVTETERTATYLALGSFLPIVMLCGIVWPIQGMHYLLQALSTFLPLTKTAESLRFIMAKGWTLEHESVYMGFISITIWLLAFMIMSILVLKFKKG